MIVNISHGIEIFTKKGEILPDGAGASREAARAGSWGARGVRMPMYTTGDANVDTAQCRPQVHRHRNDCHRHHNTHNQAAGSCAGKFNSLTCECKCFLLLTFFMTIVRWVRMSDSTFRPREDQVDHHHHHGHLISYHIMMYILSFLFWYGGWEHEGLFKNCQGVREGLELIGTQPLANAKVINSLPT